ncbi:MAG TPA: protease pro-enzyme activation domain-containing protein [Steroidobacteraceae bacterium]|nr:protease pro-enzyme activation domain-containing protein [Steroidobacteraceae bacterium]
MLRKQLACAVVLQLCALCAQSQERHALQTHVAAPANAAMMGRMPSAQRLSVAMTLSLRNETQLDSLLQRLYDPQSPDYRRFLTVAQFTEQFGPTEADYRAVISFAESRGLTVKASTPNRLVIEAIGSVAAIESAFRVKMQVYRHPTENRTFYAPDLEPAVDASLKVAGISGLSNFAPPRPMDLKRPSAATAVRSNATGSEGGQFLGSDLRAAYAPGVTLDGSGQSIGLFEFGPYNLSDVQNYFSTTGQPLNVPIINVLLNGVSGVCGSGCDDGEEVIDIQQAISMAPNLAAVYVYEGTNDTSILNRMATDNLAKQLSCSFGWLPADPASDEPIFKEFAAQGQNMFVASGDSGAFTAGGNPVFYPADDPFITAAGGTDLTTNGAGGTWQSETAWIGSSGGRSTNGLAIPSYQVPVINSSNQGSTSLRNIPDIAAEANTDNYFCANGSCQGGVGGTSLAAPRWAGFLALANQQAHGTPIGFLNPTLYALGQGANYHNDLHDVTSGNNFNSSSPNLFSAVAGFDLTTGWGSPNGQSLINALSGSSPVVLNGPHTLTPQNATGSRLDDLFSGTESGNTIDIWTANGTGAQSWVFSDVGVVPSGYYNLAVSYGAFCVDASGTNSGSVVNLQPCNGSTGQAWNVVPVSNGTYMLHPAGNTGLCLDVQGVATGDGAIVIASACHNGSNQIWAIN